MAKTPVKLPSKPELHKAGKGLSDPKKLPPKAIQSLSGRVLREGRKG